MSFIPQSDFLRETIERGFFHQATNAEELDHKMSQGIVIGYLGFDATAQSLHVGNLVQIMRLRLLQRTGHKPIVLMGGGTSRVGDPSGRDETRQLLTENQIEDNIASIKKIFARYLTFGEGPTDAMIVNNAEWLNELNYLNFLRDYGKHFSINRMMSFDSVRLRLEREQPLSFLEFNYMILQAYDFLELKQRYQVALQLGGADQWGNIVSGVDLIRRVEREDGYGLTSSLITTSTGAKMGKTAQGAVWLNAEQLSVFDFWQFWRNTHDADVGKFLRMFTDLPLTEIVKLEALEGREINEAKKILADEATRLCHGEENLAAAQGAARSFFEENNLLDDKNLPTFELSQSQLEGGINILDIFKLSGLTASNGETRRLIQGKGARMNDQVIQDENLKLTSSDFNDQNSLKLSAGKKRHLMVKLVVN